MKETDLQQGFSNQQADNLNRDTSLPSLSAAGPPAPKPFPQLSLADKYPDHTSPQPMTHRNNQNSLLYKSQSQQALPNYPQNSIRSSKQQQAMHDYQTIINSDDNYDPFYRNQQRYLNH